MNRRALGAILLVIVVGVPAVHATTGLPGFQSSPSDGTSLATDGESLTIPATANATLTGETGLDVGTSLEVRLQSTNGSQPFIRQQTTTVGDDESFAATFDLSAVTAETTVRVQVLSPSGTELVNTTGTVVAPPGGFDDTDNADANPDDDTDDSSDSAPTASIDSESETGELVLEPTADHVIQGATSVPAGTELTVRIRSSGDNPFIRTRVVTVAEGGQYEAAFDLSTVPSGARVSVMVHHEGTVLAEATGAVRAQNPTVELVYDGDSVTLESAANQTVRGESDLPRGSEVLVRLQSTNSSQPFIKQEAVTVRENGTFAGTFNVSAIEPGARFEVTVRHLDETEASASGNVTAADS